MLNKWYTYIIQLNSNRYKAPLFSLALFAIFVFIQIWKIYNSGIGTDEGNFLYLVRLLENGQNIFEDFFSRESGALLLLTPFFKIQNLSIESLRWLVFGIHLTTLSFYYLLLQNISKNTWRNTNISILSGILLSTAQPFEIYPGIFYHLYGLFLAICSYLLIRFYTQQKTFDLYTLGILTGIGIISYKGIQVFWVLVPLVIYLNSESISIYIKRTLTFFVSSSIIVASYGFYYSLKTDFFHIYNIVLSDVLQNFLVLLVFASIILPLLSYSKRIVFNVKNPQNLNLFASIGFVLGLLYGVLQNSFIIFENFYGGIILPYGFSVILLQLFTIIYTPIHKNKLIFMYFITNLILLWQGFGSRGFFTTTPNEYHLVAILIFISYNIGLFSLYFHQFKQRTYVNVLLICSVLVNFYFVISSLFGGYSMPTRFQSILYFLPILFLFANVHFFELKRKFFFPIIIISIVFSIFTYLRLPNDFTFYPINDFKESITYINTKTISFEKIFTTDMAILSEAILQPTGSFYSPWQFVGDPIYTCTQNELLKYPSACLKYETLMENVYTEKPEYILGSWRATFRLFENSNASSFLKENYREIEKIGRISIYKKIME